MRRGRSDLKCDAVWAGFLRMKYHIIANYARTKDKDIRIVQEVFKSAGKETEVHRTTKRGSAGALAAELSSRGEDCTLIVMGGDGTLHEALNGITDLKKCALGLIPCGTGNDFAASANIPHDVKKAAEIIAHGQPECVDYIELSDGLKSLNAVGMGIDVDVLKRAYSKGGGKLKYLFSLVYCLKHFRSYNFTVDYGDKTEKHFGLIAALGNGRQIGGGIKLFPDAKINDGYMDLLIVDYVSRFKIIFAFIKLMLGKINAIKEVTAARVKSVCFTPEAPCSIQAEGEIYDNVKLDAHIVEGGLNFYLPAKAAKKG